MRLSTRFSTAARNNLLGLLLFVVAWWLVALFFPRYILPSPAAVITAAPAYLGPAFLQHLALTLGRVAVGFTAALVAGSALGIAAFILHLGEHLTSVMTGLQAVPGTILGVILLLALGIGSRVPIALVALLTLPTIAINTAGALAKRSRALEQYLQAAGARRLDLVRYLYLPTLVPTVQSNLSLGLGLSLKVVVLGEFLGSQDGLGYLLNVAALYFKMKEVLFYLCVILVATALFEVAQSLIFSLAFACYFYPE